MRKEEIALLKNSKKMSMFFKGIAIFMVILVHSHQRFDLLESQNAIQRFCQMGCQVFFVLSSFGLCHTFSEESPKWLLHMRKRISKLAVGYWGAILIYAVYRIIMASVLKKRILSAINVPGVLINAFFINGLVPIGGINNTIVRGGWYVGTTVILYAIFPLLYRIYFSNKNKTWEKYRIVVFPSAIFLAVVSIVAVSGLLSPVFTCYNNSFVYFSFINQMPPFSFGLVLFDISKRFNNTKNALAFSVVLLVTSIILFFGDYKYSFVLCPSFVAASFMFLYWYLLNNQKIYDNINNDSNIVIKVINRFGEISFPIYLTHSFIVYEFSTICLRILRPINNNDFLWYIILLPIEICLVYLLGYIYNKFISVVENITKKAE